MGTRIVIVGGVAAGASAAAKARRCSEEAEIIVFEKGPAVSYANCGLPYYLSGVIRHRDELLISDADFFRERFNVMVKTGHEVTDIDPILKTVTVVDYGSGKTFRQHYDKLILAPGADPIMPPIEGIAQPFVFTLKTMEDTDKVYAHLHNRKVSEAVVVGGGLIGIEMVENLTHLGIRVSVVEFLPQVLSFLDSELAAVVAGHLQSKKVALHLADKVVAIRQEGESGIVETASGQRLPADLVIMAVGIRPNTSLARKAGLGIGKLGGILVDRFMQTSNQDIYAAGDCVESVQLVTGKPALVPMGSAANKQGRAAGANALGRKIEVKGFTGTVIVKVFDYAVGKTGLSEREAIREGLRPVSTYVMAGHHAGYYPGAKPLRMKIVTDADSGRLLGAQVIGPEGADKRIDVFATALYNRMQTEDLVHLDLAYAPPYSSARDPIIVAGMLQQNIAVGDWHPITPAALRQKMEGKEPFTLVDVRTSRELRKLGKIEGAIHIPIDELRGRLQELKPEAPIVLYCAVGLRSYLGGRILAMHGYKNVEVMTGGFNAWTYPVSSV
ncbi:MAG: FAD-dependent oxidoreductase [Deltaproteobacteria bacterium]